MATASNRKPPKPYPGFPLYAHATGRWCKKIRGRNHYFGPWDDPHGAYQRYLDQRGNLESGREAAVMPTAVTVAELANRFLTHHLERKNNGEIRAVTFYELHTACARLVAVFGKSRPVESLMPDDFGRLRADIASTRKATATMNEMQRVRRVFLFGVSQGLVPSPPRYGESFKRPSRREIRLERNARGELMFSPAEIRAMLKSAHPILRAMVWLGINCGFGNADVATLTLDAIDFDGGWNNHPRPKTGVRRRVPLWPETMAALRVALEMRPDPRNPAHQDLFFITRQRHSFYKENSDNPISNETNKLVTSLGIHRPGLGFYTLRRTFETIAGDTRDQVAVDAIMGHARDDMASIYRQTIFEQRLREVCDHVRGWLG